MSSHRRRRCEVPGGHLCPVLTSFPGKLKKLRHRWKRKSGGASRRKKGEPRGGSARRKPREQGSQTAHRTDKGAEAMTPTGAQSPGAGPPTTEQRAEPGGRAAKRTRGGGSSQAGQRSRGPNDTLRPPGAARPRAQGARSGEKGRRPRGPTARRRHSASARATRPPWAGRPSAAARGRKLGRGIDAARAQRRLAPMRQRSTGTAVSCQQLPGGFPVGRSHSGCGRAPAAC